MVVHKQLKAFRVPLHGDPIDDPRIGVGEHGVRLPVRPGQVAEVVAGKVGDRKLHDGCPVPGVVGKKIPGCLVKHQTKAFAHDQHRLPVIVEFGRPRPRMRQGRLRPRAEPDRQDVDQPPTSVGHLQQQFFPGSRSPRNGDLDLALGPWGQMDL